MYRPFLLLVPLLVYAVLRVSALGVYLVPTGAASIAFGYPWWARVTLVIVSSRHVPAPSRRPVGTDDLLRPSARCAVRDSRGRNERGPACAHVASPAPAGPRTNDGQSRGGHPLGHTASCVEPPADRHGGGRTLSLSAERRPLRDRGGGVRLAGPEKCKDCVIAACLVTAAGMGLSARVAWRWHTPLKHWETTVSDHPRSAGAHARLALLLLKDVSEHAGGPDDPRVARAKAALVRALDLNPALSDAWEGKGLLALMRRDCTAGFEAAVGHDVRGLSRDGEEGVGVAQRRNLARRPTPRFTR